MNLCIFILGVLGICCLKGDAIATERKATIGRIVAIGVTDAPKTWKLKHPADRNFIVLLDTATGLIEICSDVKGICRLITGSEREPDGNLPGRFSPLKITRASNEWKTSHRADTYMIYSLDTTIGRIQICGDVENTCISISSKSALKTSGPKVVMLYRRADTAAIAGRIYDRLVAHFGYDSVFMDIYNIPFATDWREQVRKMSLQGGALVVLVGPKWLGKGSDGHVRINDADDPVRNELETALGATVPIFPVLVEGASMPKALELPETLKAFADINAATIDTGRDFDDHMSRLISAIDVILLSRTPPTSSMSTSK